MLYIKITTMSCVLIKLSEVLCSLCSKESVLGSMSCLLEKHRSVRFINDSFSPNAELIAQSGHFNLLLWTYSTDVLKRFYSKERFAPESSIAMV